MNETYIPAIITASVALLAAISAQILNNWLTYRRENKKYLKEVYEKFLSEYFIDILTYARISTQPRKEHDTNGDVNISAIIAEMFKKSHYGDKHIQSLNLEYNTLYYMEDLKGDSKEITQLKICYYFLLYSKKILKQIHFNLEPIVKHQLTHSIKVFSYLYICSTMRDYEEAVINATNIRMFNLDILEKYSLRYFKSLMNTYDIKAKETFLKEVDETINEFLKV